MFSTFIFNLSLAEYQEKANHKNDSFVISDDHHLSDLIFDLEKQDKAVLDPTQSDHLIRLYEIQAQNLLPEVLTLIQNDAKRPSPTYSLIRLNRFYYLSHQPEKKLTVMLIDQS